VTALRTIRTTVNGVAVDRRVEPRRLLADFLRDDLDLRGTHLGCEHGVCGACTVILDGAAVRSCLMLAVQANGKAITTVEGLAPLDGELHPLQRAFHEAHALQCGFCTPGFLLSLVSRFEQWGPPADDEIRTVLAGNICRCTGYQNIEKAVRAFRDSDWAVS